MKKALIGIGVLVALAVGAKLALDSMERGLDRDSASRRVEACLRGLSSGGDFEQGFNMWFSGAGTGNVSQEIYNAYVDRMNAWLDERDIAYPIDYEITGTTLVKGREGLDAAIVEVQVTIDQTPMVILAEEGKPLSWVD